MRYGEVASELRSMAKQMTDLADKLSSIESATPSVSKMNDSKLANKLILTIPDACEALSLSRATMYQLVHRNDFPSIRIGRRVLIPEFSSAEEHFHGKIGTLSRGNRNTVAE